MEKKMIKQEITINRKNQSDRLRSLWTRHEMNTKRVGASGASANSIPLVQQVAYRDRKMQSFLLHIVLCIDPTNNNF
jgi:hypothetical protein